MPSLEASCVCRRPLSNTSRGDSAEYAQWNILHTGSVLECASSVRQACARDVALNAFRKSVCRATVVGSSRRDCSSSARVSCAAVSEPPGRLTPYWMRGKRLGSWSSIIAIE